MPTDAKPGREQRDIPQRPQRRAARSTNTTSLDKNCHATHRLRAIRRHAAVAGPGKPPRPIGPAAAAATHQRFARRDPASMNNQAAAAAAQSGYQITDPTRASIGPRGGRSAVRAGPRLASTSTGTAAGPGGNIVSVAASPGTGRHCGDGGRGRKRARRWHGSHGRRHRETGRRRWWNLQLMRGRRQDLDGTLRFLRRGAAVREPPGTDHAG